MRTATMQIQGVFGSGRATFAAPKPTLWSAPIASSGVRIVKMSAGIRMRAMRSFGKKPITRRPPGGEVHDDEGCFKAPSRAAVDAFWKVGVARGEPASPTIARLAIERWH
jgi:hypothetical protein